MQKKMRLLLLAIVCIAMFALPLSAAENFTKGFRGIPWGAVMPKDNGSGNNKWNLYDVGEYLSEKRYERDNEELSFAGAEVLFIEYCFQDSLGFAKVQIFFKGVDNYKHLRRVCFENWGQPVTGEIDGEMQGPRKLEKEKPDLNDVNYKSRDNTWRGKGIRITLQHDNTGTNRGVMDVNLLDYYDKFSTDNDKYPQEQHIDIISQLEEWGLL